MIVISPKVAAGMNTVLDVEIFAVAVGVVGESGLGHVGHHVEIVTETDILYLPVTANILLNSSIYNHQHVNRTICLKLGLQKGSEAPRRIELGRSRQSTRFAVSSIVLQVLKCLYTLPFLASHKIRKIVRNVFCLACGVVVCCCLSLTNATYHDGVRV